MSPLETLILQCVEKKKQVDALREQSPELATALALCDEYHGLVEDIREMCNPVPVLPAVTLKRVKQRLQLIK